MPSDKRLIRMHKADVLADIILRPGQRAGSICSKLALDRAVVNIILRNLTRDGSIRIILDHVGHQRFYVNKRSRPEDLEQVMAL